MELHLTMKFNTLYKVVFICNRTPKLLMWYDWHTYQQNINILEIHLSVFEIT